MKTNKKGFTLTEILLAVSIVGLIGIALAALTTSAARETSSGKVRMMLRSNLSQFIRKIRHDVQSSHRVIYTAGLLTAAGTVNKTPVLVLGKDMDLSDNALSGKTPKYIVYCFQRGDITQFEEAGTMRYLQPVNNAWDGGKIYRKEIAYTPWGNGSINTICSTVSNRDEVLTNVKLITDDYRVPYFNVKRQNTSTLTNNDIVYNTEQVSSAYNAADQYLISGRVIVKIILELPSTPIINEVIEEEIMLSNGMWDAGRSSRTSYTASDYN